MTALSPEPGRLALVRQRRYLVENVTRPPSPQESMLVDLSCLDDDGWSAVADKGFWARLAHEAGQGGVAFGYARGRDGDASTPLLREMIDPDRDVLNDTQLRFRAPRSLRDVEPGVLLGIKTPEDRDIE